MELPLTELTNIWLPYNILVPYNNRKDLGVGAPYNKAFNLYDAIAQVVSIVGTGGSGSGTDLSTATTSTTITIGSSTGDSTLIPTAGTTAGVMSAAQATTLAALPTLTGVPTGSTNLGIFVTPYITDYANLKNALEQLGTAIAGIGGGGGSVTGAASGTYISGGNVRLGTNPLLEDVVINGQDLYATTFDRQRVFSAYTGSASTPAKNRFTMGSGLLTSPNVLRQEVTSTPTTYGEVTAGTTSGSHLISSVGGYWTGLVTIGNNYLTLGQGLNGLSLHMDNNGMTLEGIPVVANTVQPYTLTLTASDKVEKRAYVFEENIIREVIVSTTPYAPYLAMNGSRHRPYGNIAQAVNAAVAGDTIVITAGLHTVTTAVIVDKALTFHLQPGATVYGVGAMTAVFDVILSTGVVKFVGSGKINTTGNIKCIKMSNGGGLILENISMVGDRDLVGLSGPAYFQNVRLEMTGTTYTPYSVTTVSGTPTIQALNVAATHAPQPTTTIEAFTVNAGLKAL